MYPDVYISPAVPPPPSAEDIRDVNSRYHDVAAPDYDSKWGIDFGAKGRRQVQTIRTDRRATSVTSLGSGR